MPEIDEIYELLQTTVRSIGGEITSPWFYFQLGMILAGAGLAHLLAISLRSRVDITSFAMGWPTTFRLAVRVLIRYAAFGFFAALMAITRVIMVASTWPSRSYLLVVAANLAAAWLLIRLATSLIRNDTAVKLVSITAWCIAALSILGLLEQVTAALDAVAISFGGHRLTLLLALKVSALLAFALWLANVAGNFVDARISNLSDLTPSVRVLASKLVRILFICLAVVIVLAAAGVDLSALAIFSGAIGVGIGFGLQKIVGNFVSGVILLADKSVKPGDIVTIGESHGRVRAMNTRYISVSGNDGREVADPERKARHRARGELDLLRQQYARGCDVLDQLRGQSAPGVRDRRRDRHGDAARRQGACRRPAASSSSPSTRCASRCRSGSPTPRKASAMCAAR